MKTHKKILPSEIYHRTLVCQQPLLFRLPRTALTTSHRTKRIGDNPNCKIQGIQSYPHRALSHPHHTQPTVRTMATAAAEREGF